MPFEATLYKLINKTGNQVTVKDEDNRLMNRNVTEVKIFNEADKLKDTRAPPKETEM